MNIPATEKIILKDSKSAIAFGFECTERGRFKVEDIFSLDAKYVIYTKTMEGEYIKDKNTLTFHPCTYEDFYNLYNESFDYLSISSYFCLDDNTQVIEGIWNDQIFTYYEFSVISKNKTLKNLDNTEEYLFGNDCKFQFFYTDITIDLYNYKQPIAPYLNSFFIQLNPTLFIKRNIYFMNQYLTDDDYILGVIQNYDKNIQQKALFSRYEEYYLYVGLNKSISQPYNAHDLAKVYVRADLRKTDIRTNYQKLMEFYANATSLLIGIFRVLVIVFNFIDSFYAENSVSKKLFFLKDFRDNNHFDIFKKSKQIKELISLTDLSQTELSEVNSFETNFKDILMSKNPYNNLDSRTNTDKSQKYIEMKKKLGRNSFSFTREKSDKGINDVKSNNSRNAFVLSSKYKNEEKKDYNKQINIINNNLNNIIEVIISYTCRCCMTKKLAIKKNIKDKANEIIYNKLDIVTYIRNMIFIDIINETILGENIRDIINLISRPILSNNKEEKYELSKFYDHYSENDFNKFYEEITEIMQKTDKKEKESNIISIVNKNLKEII